MGLVNSKVKREKFSKEHLVRGMRVVMEMLNSHLDQSYMDISKMDKNMVDLSCSYKEIKNGLMDFSLLMSKKRINLNIVQEYE